MKTIAFFDAKSYDRESFGKINTRYDIRYFDSRLTRRTVQLAEGCEGVCAFVNDEIDAAVLERLRQMGVGIIAMRCAGYSNVDLAAARGRIRIARVPGYSPHAVAEHAMGMLLSVNRRLHRAYTRTRDCNFSIAGFTGVDLYGKTVGVVGTGRIGRAFMQICRGFGMEVLAFDPYPVEEQGVRYVPLPELFRRSDVISLHCPLSESSYHILDAAAFAQMKRGVFIINTSRGALVDAQALLDALNRGIVRGAGLDVYEEEAGYFFRDKSEKPMQDAVLSLLLSRPNVLITSHQAFLTEEALENIARTTLENLDAFFAGEPLPNEVGVQAEKN